MYTQIRALPVYPTVCLCHSLRVRVWTHLQYQEVEASWWVRLDNTQFICLFAVILRNPGNQQAFPSHKPPHPNLEYACYTAWTLKKPRVEVRFLSSVLFACWPAFILIMLLVWSTVLLQLACSLSHPALCTASSGLSSAMQACPISSCK